MVKSVHGYRYNHARSSSTRMTLSTVKAAIHIQHKEQHDIDHLAREPEWTSHLQAHSHDAQTGNTLSNNQKHTQHSIATRIYCTLRRRAMSFLSASSRSISRLFWSSRAAHCSHSSQGEQQP
jgi:hypothetical protein